MNPTSGHPSDRITGSPTDIRRSDRTSGFHPRLTILLVSVLFFLSACRRPEPPAVGDPATDTGLDPAVRAHIRNWVAAAKAQPGDATVRARLGIALAANGLWKEARSAFQATAVLADKGYVSEAIFEAIRRMGAEVVIPNKSNAVAPRQVDYYLYKARHLVENLFKDLKNFRRMATRYDKLDVAYLSFVHLASVYLWLK